MCLAREAFGKAGYYDVRSTEMSRYPRSADGQRQNEKPNKIKRPKMSILFTRYEGVEQGVCIQTFQQVHSYKIKLDRIQ
jgi:hypothetical protein